MERKAKDGNQLCTNCNLQITEQFGWIENLKRYFEANFHIMVLYIEATKQTVALQIS